MFSRISRLVEHLFVRLTAFSAVFAVSRTSFESINFEYGGGNPEILAIFEHIIWPLHLTVPVNMSFI